MKTGREVIDRAFNILGYTNGYGESGSANDAELLKRSAAVLNQIYSELFGIENPGKYPEKELNVNDEIPLHPVTVNDIMPYGVAMLIAQSDGNGDMQSFIGEIYNQKRCAVPKPQHFIRDTMPRGGF